MSYYSRTNIQEIEIGSAFVTVRGKYATTCARILADETNDGGERLLVLDRLLDRNGGKYQDADHRGRVWTASGAFVTELRTGGDALSEDYEGDSEG